MASREGSEQAGVMEGTEVEEEETNMPSVNERLGKLPVALLCAITTVASDPSWCPAPPPGNAGCLRPSRELLEYYRRRIAEYDSEYDKLLQKLDKYKCTYQQVVSVDSAYIMYYVQHMATFSSLCCLRSTRTSGRLDRGKMRSENCRKLSVICR